MLFTKMSGRVMHSALVGLVCLVTASAFCCSSVGSSHITTCLESERHALLRFKQGLVDESNALASWKSEKDCCKWRGISCNPQTGHVTHLNFSFSYYDPYTRPHPEVIPLRGEISPSLLELGYLSSLDLSYNDFGGTMIPKFIGSLSQLKELRLAQANFSGSIPLQLGNLSNLHTLDLSWNWEVSLDNQELLSRLSSLRYLYMPYVNLLKVVNWPRSLSKLTSLRELQLSECNLRDVSPRSLSSINSSTSLQLLDLSINNLNSSILDWIANVSTNLVHLDLSWNSLEGPISDVFTSMLSLATLDLSENHFTGGIPENFQNLCSLESLVLQGNGLSGNIEDSLKSLSCAHNTLEIFVLYANQFWGSLAEIKPFTKLRVLDLSFNTLNGSLSESIGKLSSLEYLGLFYNSVNGSLFESIGKLSSLKRLYLSGNSMSGVITEHHFSNLSSLCYLSFSHNNFSINLSSDWNPPFQLDFLDMSSCKVGPGIPKWIMKQTNLTDLHLSNAGLLGSLPNQFWDLFPRLSDLDLSMNQIHGKLPNLSKTRLHSLDLSSNLFSGEVPSIPPELGSLNLPNNNFSKLRSSFCATLKDPRLYYLDISRNLLSGVLPNCLMKFQSLNYLNLGRNKLSGRIPSWLDNLTAISYWRLHENNFSGELPSLENCTGLLLLDVGDNNLSGEIPTWIGQSLRDLEVLRLRSNKFSGILPFSICNLAAIHVLDLSHNNISGGLPHCFNNITNEDSYISFSELPVDVVWKGLEIEFGRNIMGMRSIDISSNYLSGEIPQSITSMAELISLNLSRNCLNGKLPENFGDMKMLESLDLSRNKISGNVPASMASLNFLSVLDLSSNNLSGRIPLSTQLQSFNSSAYMGNLGLCGPPLTPSCPGDETTQDGGITKGSAADNKEHNSHISLGLLISITLGFITGFWVVCGSLLLKSSWRYAYFKFCDDSRDWVYVKAAVYKAKIQRKFQR